MTDDLKTPTTTTPYECPACGNKVLLRDEHNRVFCVDCDYERYERREPCPDCDGRGHHSAPLPREIERKAREVERG